MRFVFFYHSLISDWNHGNAHFLRGVATELVTRGHQVTVFEPRDAWSVQNLLQDHGPKAVDEFHNAYPLLSTVRYDENLLDDAALDRALEGADVVIVHEWSSPEIVRRIGAHRARGGDYHLFFHDTHHRIVTRPEEMARFDLSHYDGVLAFGRVIAELYVARSLAERVWVWHEAADVRVFRPMQAGVAGDLVWIGNWGDDERGRELEEFLIEPVESLKLSALVRGVRYPEAAQRRLAAAGIRYEGWVPNFQAPQLFAAHRVTVHVPRRPYVEALPGIPTIRVFEAMAAGIPLISAPWDDAEHLFQPGRDYLIASNGAHMRELLHDVLSNPALASELTTTARRTILAKHTCAHRVDELFHIIADLRSETEEDLPRCVNG